MPDRKPPRSSPGVGMARLLAPRPLCPWGFPRQEDWSRSPFPPPGDLPDPGIEPASPVFQVDSLPLTHLGSPAENLTLPKTTEPLPQLPKQTCHSCQKWSCRDGPADLCQVKPWTPPPRAAAEDLSYCPGGPGHGGGGLSTQPESRGFSWGPYVSIH